MTMKLQAAIKLAAQYGNTSLSIDQETLAANPMVVVCQDFTKSGKSFAKFVRACGKYRGNTCGSAY